MSVLPLPCRRSVRYILGLAGLVGLAAMLATATPAADSKTKRTADTNRAAPKQDEPPAPPAKPEAGPDDDFGPPGPFGPPPGKDDRGRAKPFQREGRPSQGDARQPGSMRGPDGPRRGSDGPPFGPGGPRWPGSIGPGQPFGGPQMNMEKNDPELFKLMKAEGDLERATRETIDKYREASKDQRGKIKDELQKLVTKQFEARQQRRALELKRFEDELKRLRDAADRREKNRQQIIDKRVAELLGEENEPGF